MPKLFAMLCTLQLTRFAFANWAAVMPRRRRRGGFATISAISRTEIPKTVAASDIPKFFANAIAFRRIAGDSTTRPIAPRGDACAVPETPVAIRPIVCSKMVGCVGNV